SQIDLDMEVARAAKDAPIRHEEPSQTLLPAETTTAREPRTTEDVFGAPKPPAPREDEEEIDVESVFGKLKGLKTKE
ncbi:MAG: DUF1013 domain-containing protein, partial [Hyphomicrobiales bacterium]|nr:DUF1013 domain-containing protein [Hyphomicrobiales bacterium]